MSGSLRSFRFLKIAALGLTGAAAFAIGVTIWSLHSDAINDAYQDSNHLAVVLANQIANSIQSIDLVLTEIKEREESLDTQAPDDFDRVVRGDGTHQFLMQRLARLQQAKFITLVDKNGKLVNTTQQWPSPEIDVSDRAHFRHVKNSDDKRIYISDALVDRLKGTRIIVFSKRINGANNRFLGEVLVAVRLTYFERIYNSISSLPDQTFVLLRRDGTVIARYPDQVVHAGEKIPAKSPWHRLILQGGGTFRAPGFFDGEARLMAVRSLRDYPLVVNVGVTEKAALATWRIQAVNLGIGTLLAMFCAVFLLKALGKQFNRLATAKAALAEKAHKLKSANEQLSTSKAQTSAALDNMSQGLVMFDSSTRLVVGNQRYLEMYGISPEIVRPECSLREILAHRAATGSFCADEIEQYIAEVQASVGNGTVFQQDKQPTRRSHHFHCKSPDGKRWMGCDP